jgi:hypothetical protein
MEKDVKKVTDDVKDAVHEVKHRTAAHIEHIKRDVAGDKMTTGEKVKSFVHEDVENTKADVDKAKRTIRDHA